MKLTYSRTARSDLAWYRVYYRSVFSSGSVRAARQFQRTIDHLLANPFIGHPIGDEGMREFSIPKMPFSIIYRVLEDRIEIARIWDQRADPAESGFHEEELALT